MSLFSSNYLMNIEKYKINNKNKKNKYITSRPSFLMESKTYRYFKEKESNDKKVNMTLTSNNFNNKEKQAKHDIYNYNIKSPINNHIIINKNTKKFIKNIINDENKENLKNKYNTNTANINNKSKTERNIILNNYNKENINPKNNINDNSNYKKINIKPKKKGRTLSSNINKIINENIDNINALKTYRNETKKDKDLMPNEYMPYHKKSNSIIISNQSLNLFPSNNFCINNLFKQRQNQKNKSHMRNNLINLDNNNRSLFNNTSNEFYTRLKQIIPCEENNKINNYMTKDYSNINTNSSNKIINKSFTSLNFLSKFCLNRINQYQSQLNKNNNFNYNYLNQNKIQKKHKKKSIANLSNPNPDFYNNKSRDYSLLNKNTQTTEKITKKILKIDSCTIPGYSANGIKQKNLDSFFLEKNYLDKEENFLIGICDGHGIYGDLISQYISQKLPCVLKNISKENIIKTFIELNNSLINNTKIDCSLSGTTCTSLIISLDKIICSNIGNTRAILARYENGYYTTINLNRDHKPTESDEIKRVISQGGIIRQNFDKIRKINFGPERIFLKNSDIPGLSMSRTFGDNLAHTIGVINIPEVINYEFKGGERFIVIATDSIWQYIDSDECVEIIKTFYEKNLDAIGALNALVTEAIKRWKKQENKIEDITAVVIFFE